MRKVGGFYECRFWTWWWIRRWGRGRGIWGLILWWSIVWFGGRPLWILSRARCLVLVRCREGKRLCRHCECWRCRFGRLRPLGPILVKIPDKCHYHSSILKNTYSSKRQLRRRSHYPRKYPIPSRIRIRIRWKIQRILPLRHYLDIRFPSCILSKLQKYIVHIWNGTQIQYEKGDLFMSACIDVVPDDIGIEDWSMMECIYFMWFLIQMLFGWSLIAFFISQEIWIV